MVLVLPAVAFYDLRSLSEGGGEGWVPGACRKPHHAPQTLLRRQEPLACNLHQFFVSLIIIIVSEYNI